jgi:hypothetical protein
MTGKVSVLWRVLAALIISSTGAAFGQSGAGSITGTVRDSNGGAVPGASVTIINPANNVRQTATTNEDGVFVSPQLPPGTYTISVEKAGFKKVEKSNVILSTSDKLNAGDFVLQVGEVAETVTVQADTGQLQIKSESGERSDLVTNRQIKDLALNGRNILDLTRTIPGIINVNQNATSTVTNAGGTFTVNGTRSNMHEITVDGATNLNTGNNTGLLVTVNPDALAEVKVLTSNYQAEYGRAGGGFVQLTTRSGTNEFHSTVRYFRRHDSLNANNFFNNARGQPRNLYRFNDYGYDIGGPVYFPRFGEGGPRLWRGKDKLFFFFSQEYYRQLVPEVARNIRVPTAAERNGDFRATATVRDVNNCLGNGFGAPFPGNQIPRQCWYGDGQILNIYPLPNVSGSSQFNYTSQRSSRYPRREDILRVDYQIGARTSLSGRFIRNQDEQLFAYGTTSAAFNWPLTFTSRQNGPGYTLGFTLTHSFSPTLINEFIYAPSRGGVTIAMVDDLGTRAANNITVPLLFPDANPGGAIPTFSYDTNLTATVLFNNQTFAEANFNGSPFKQTFSIDNFMDNLTKVIGNHTVKTGFYWQRSHNKRTSFGPIQANIEFNFSSLDATNPLNAGHPYANALLGVYAQYQQASVQLRNDFVYNNVEGYIQDTWKVTPRLTLDYGLRLSYYQPLYDEEGQLDFFNPALYDRSRAPRIYFPVCLNNAYPCASGAAAANRRAVDPALLAPGFVPTLANTEAPARIGLLVPNTGDITNGLGRASSGYPRGGFESDKVLLGPRFGFAYDLTGKGDTVARGGFGITYDRIYGDITIDAITNPPNVLLPTLFFGRLSDIPNLRGSGVRGVPTVVGVDQGGELPTVYTYSLSVQRNIGWGTVVDVAYVGTLSRHLPRQRNLNAIPYLTTFTRVAQDPTRFSGGVIPAVEPGLPAAYSQAGFNFSGANALPVDFLRPFPGYGDINFRSFDATANYNSLQVGVTRRFAANFTFGLAYTFSKTLTTASNATDFTHPYDLRGYEYRPADFDRPHVLAINYVYNLPKASRYLGHHWLARGVLDNWQISGISMFVSGTPFDLSLSGLGTAGARLVGAPTAAGSTSSLSAQQPRFYLTGDPSQGPNGLQINPSAFAVPGIGNIGPYPRAYLRNPGWNNHDISVFKNFPFGGEGSRYLQLRFEFFNAFNHTQFSAVNAGAVTITPGSTVPVFNVRPAGNTSVLGTFFGEYSAARDPRIIQLAAKVYF